MRTFARSYNATRVPGDARIFFRDVFQSDAPRALGPLNALSGSIIYHGTVVRRARNRAEQGCFDSSREWPARSLLIAGQVEGQYWASLSVATAKHTHTQLRPVRRVQ